MSRLLSALHLSAEEVSCKEFSLEEVVLEEMPVEDEPAPLRRDLPLNGLSSVFSVQPSICPDSRLEALTNPGDFAAEQFRVLGARLEHLAETRSLKTLLVTSTSFREGKSLVSLNLAISLAQRSGKKVLLVEGDLRKPALCNMLGLPRLRGFSDWLHNEQPLTEFLCRLAGMDLWLLPAGETCDRPLSDAQSARLNELPKQADKHFDWIVIDSSPLLVADASVLSRVADGTLVVVRQGSTEKKALQRSLPSLERVLGFVFNDASSINPRDYKHYYSPAKPNAGAPGRTA
jgi:protein-tyrosine kinase